jgi:hypothetical protein
MTQPAFPCDLTAYDEEVKQQFQGMTLRDYFAAKAMNSLISDPDWRSDMVWHETAYAAYQMADAMMEARNG